MMSEKDIEELIESLLLDDEYYDGIKSTNTFKEEGILTNNKGLVIRTNDNSKFQITIVKTD